MSRWIQGLCVVLGSIAATVVVLAGALAWGPHHCKVALPMVIGCVIGSYESLAGGMIAASAALIAGWLAWNAVQRQIDAEERRAKADRIEVEEELKGDIDTFAEGLAAIWIILDYLDKSGGAAIDPEKKIEGVKYGIEEISKKNWLSTSRTMVRGLGWQRRRSYEQLFDSLERLGRFRDTTHGFDVWDVLSEVKNVSIYFEQVQPDTAKYFEGLFRRGGKAWTLGDAINDVAGIRKAGDTPQ